MLCQTKPEPDLLLLLLPLLALNKHVLLPLLQLLTALYTVFRAKLLQLASC